ncbi:protein of unknown function [Frankineae bacterium MT45]|nr:protein of unknown function [Frankineae bacterium MT45]
MTFSDPNLPDSAARQYQPAQYPPPQYGAPQYPPPPYEPVQHATQAYPAQPYPAQPYAGQPYPGQPYPPQYASAYPAAYPPAYTSGYPVEYAAVTQRQSLAGLATALRALLVITSVVSAALVAAWLNELRLLSAIRTDPASVNIDTAKTADSFVAMVTGFRILLLIATGVVTIIWLYRARINAGSYGGHPQGRSPAWSIGGWFIPVACLWIPYTIVVDAQLASEQGPRGLRSVSVIRAWWAAWVLGNVASFAARGADSHDLDSLTTHAQIALASAVLWLIAGLLMMAVVSRLSAAQGARNAQLVPGRTDRLL